MYLVKFVIIVLHFVYCLFVSVYNMVLIVPLMIDYVLFFIRKIDGHHASECKVLPSPGCGNAHKVEERDEHASLEDPP